MAITFGSASAPSQITENLDSVFGTSLAAYRKELINNIGAMNAFFFEMIKKEYYESQDGGKYIQIPLMYALASADSYSGYDELSTAPVDGITDAIYEWRQCAVPIVYSMLEVTQNKQRIVDLITARIKQGEMGLQEYFARSFMHGAGADGGNLYAVRTSTINGSSSVEPLGKLIDYDPTQSRSVGNINQSTSSWWRNKTKASSASTFIGFIQEFQNIFNTCSLGTGGKPKLILMDQVTYELWVTAWWERYRSGPPTDLNFPFQNVTFMGAHIIMDDKVPDAAANTVTATEGSIYLMNTEFFKLMYESEHNFVMFKDENGKTFQKPTNGDSRVGHMGWYGNVTTSNRRKQGVMGSIARTLTVA